VSDESKGVTTLVSELRELIVAYLKQEAVEPIKQLGRFLAFGVAGSLFLSVGLVLLTLSVLRVLQTETDTMFTGNLSWLPYVFTFVLCGALAALAARAISANRRKEAA
jgi:hypothetical protein